MYTAEYEEDELPDLAVASIEVDVAFRDDPNRVKSDLVDGAIGGLLLFHETFGAYALGASVSTACSAVGRSGS